MSDATANGLAPDGDREDWGYLSEGGHTLRSWLATTDHKRIAILYAITLTVFFFIGGAAISVARLELVTPAQDLVSADTYNRLFSIHGIIMVWFFLVPSIPATFGNFLLPMMIGARDLAFPKLNLFSWYLTIIGGALIIYMLLAGGVDTGWTFYVPFADSYSNTNVVAALLAIFVSGFGTIATGINFIVTTHTLRAPGMRWFRMPVFVWALYTVSIVIVLATPVLAIVLMLVMVERVFGLPIFDPAHGGDPVLFQHMFWFYSHPAVYIMILPAMGVVSEVIPCFARRRLFGYTFMVYALVAISMIGFSVWGHHMFVSGQSAYANVVFSFLSFMVAVPSAIKVFNWTATLYRGQITFEAPMLYAFGFVGLFTIGGLSGLFLASIPIDVQATDTYFVIAHFHYVMVGGTVAAFFAGLHFWWPKVTGRMYPEPVARFAAILMFFGFNFTFFPQFVMGWAGMPRRYGAYPDEFQIYHVLSTAGAMVLGIAYLLPLCYLSWSLVWGRRASGNPWEATGLEWQTASPPPKHNFLTMPTVDTGPYAYHAEQVAPDEDRQGAQAKDQREDGR